jgi:hypothetical protein
MELTLLPKARGTKLHLDVTRQYAKRRHLRCKAFTTVAPLCTVQAVQIIISLAKQGIGWQHREGIVEAVLYVERKRKNQLRGQIASLSRLQSQGVAAFKLTLSQTIRGLARLKPGL